jgi:ribonuclease-3
VLRAVADRVPGLDHAFRDPELLAVALTHRSAGRTNNERLEFLGDAVLGIVAAEALYTRFPRATEGELTRLRAELVREATLATFARELQLGDAMRLGPGELRSGGFRRDSILADAFEALVGAVWLDGGWDACRRALLPLLEPRIAALEPGRVPKDAKTELQELVQGRGLPLPTYELAGTTGDEHRKTFFVRCSVPDLAVVADGEGGSRRAAETHAAQLALARIAELSSAA